MYHSIKPASLQQQLEVIHLNPDKAEVFSQTWATAGPELVEKLKRNIFAPKKVGFYSACKIFFFNKLIIFILKLKKTTTVLTTFILTNINIYSLTKSYIIKKYTYLFHIIDQ